MLFLLLVEEFDERHGRAGGDDDDGHARRVAVAEAGEVLGDRLKPETSGILLVRSRHEEPPELVFGARSLAAEEVNPPLHLGDQLQIVGVRGLKCALDLAIGEVRGKFPRTIRAVDLAVKRVQFLF